MIKLDDGVAMDAWLMKPPGFDDTKKYPVRLLTTFFNSLPLSLSLSLSLPLSVSVLTNSGELFESLYTLLLRFLLYYEVAAVNCRC
eukprot:COSAG05_NODE_12178_length_479_cov_3.394464_1_plen_85_part_10